MALALGLSKRGMSVSNWVGKEPPNFHPHKLLGLELGVFERAYSLDWG